MMSTEEKHKKRGLIATISFHLVLLLLFAFFGMSYTIPPPEEEGITINFGFTDAGKMVNPTENEVAEEPNSAEEIVEPTPPTEDVIEETITQDIEDAPVIKEKKEDKIEEVVEEPPKEEPKPDKNLSSAIDKWKNKKDQGGGDGNTNEAGNQGAIDGDKNSNNYTGGGNGNGTTFNLSGRSLLSSPSIKDNSQDEGKVVVDIIVDKSGKVLRANPGARGSTTTSSILYKKAKDAALRTKFNANPNAAEEQKGQMTFIFILN